MNKTVGMSIAVLLVCLLVHVSVLVVIFTAFYGAWVALGVGNTGAALAWAVWGGLAVISEVEIMAGSIKGGSKNGS